MLAFQTLYIAISPHNGPSIYTIIPMIETVYGVWYLKGGMYTMAQQMAKAFEDLGGIIKLLTSVEKIVTENKNVIGLKLDSQFVASDYVICNADFPYALKNLIKNPKAKGKYSDKKIDGMDYACSCFLLYLGLDQKVDSLGVHNVYFAKDFNKNIEDIFAGVFPEDFSMYLYSPSQIDSSMAPEGKEGIYMHWFLSLSFQKDWFGRQKRHKQ